MCCTFTESKMSDTKIYVGEAEKDGKTVHVLAYQNSAETNGPNAMVIPFPTDVPMGPENVIDTSKFKNFLKDITEASKVHTKGFDRRSRGMTLGVAAADDLAEVFDVGSYTVILASRVSQIPEALERVPENKRPNVTTNFLIGYGKLYPKQPIAVCCWNGAIEAEPLMWWYEPRDRSTLFIPTMDAHDGQAPKLGEQVDTDHIISVGSIGPTTGCRVVYSQKIPAAVQELLPTHVFGKRLPYRMPNEDCLVKTALLHQSREDYFNGGKAVEIKRGSYSIVMNGWH